MRDPFAGLQCRSFVATTSAGRGKLSRLCMVLAYLSKFDSNRLAGCSVIS